MAKEVYKTLCRMCDDHCGINVYVEDGKVVDIDGNKNHPWNEGRLCVKGRLGVDFQNDAKRLLKPLKKTENGFVEIDLETALDEIAGKIKEIQKKYGKKAMSVWKGEAIGFAQQEEIYRRFIHAIDSPNYFSNDSQCFVGRWIGYSLVYGTWAAQPDFINSKCAVMWGANPPAAHPNMTRQIMDGKDKGGKLLVIDSRLSNIARKAEVFLQILPGTDGAVANGMMREFINGGHIDKEFIDNYSTGFEELKDYVQAFTPERVVKETGVDKDLYLEAVKLIVDSAPRVVNYVGNGLEHHENGINNIRAVACIDGLIGAIDVFGGNYLPVGFGARDLTLYKDKPLMELGPIGADRFPVLYDFRHECHTMTAMNTILSEKPYPLKGMLLSGANPALTNPNTPKVIEALSSLDLLVVRDLYMSETAELADYVLPAASYLERSEVHCHPGFHVANLTRKITEHPEVQDEYQFLHDIAHRIGAGDYFPWENEEALTRYILEPTGVSLETLREHPDGYVYAPKKEKKYIDRKNAGEKPFNTPSGLFEFKSDYLAERGYQSLPEYIPPKYITDSDSEFPYTLITGARKVPFYHGRNRNFKRTLTAFPNGVVELHPADAEKLGVKQDEKVKITSKIGSMEIPVDIVDETEIMPGITQISHGWKNENVNLITHDDVFDPIDGFPLMKAVEVRIEKV